MLTDDDIASIQQDFGLLVSKVPCTIKRGTTKASGIVAAPYRAEFTWTCTVLNLAQVKDAYLTGFSKSMVQATKNPRLIQFPLPLPTGKEIKRGDMVEVGGEDFQVLDLDNNDTYQYLRTAFCQFVEGSSV